MSAKDLLAVEYSGTDQMSVGITFTGRLGYKRGCAAIQSGSKEQFKKEKPKANEH
jgi:hypothetical protein